MSCLCIFYSGQITLALGGSTQADMAGAKMCQTKMRVLYLWCQEKKHETNLPLPCEVDHKWHLRLDHT